MKTKSLFASRAQSYRKHNGMSPADVAQAMRDRGFAKWTEHSVVGVENDRREVSHREFYALASILGCEPGELDPDPLASVGLGGSLGIAA